VADANAAKDQRDAALKRVDEVTAELSKSKGAGDAAVADRSKLEADLDQARKDAVAAREQRDRATFERDEAIKVADGMKSAEQPETEGGTAVVAIVGAVIGAVAVLLFSSARKALAGG
jgi:hypothetical protein